MRNKIILLIIFSLIIPFIISDKKVFASRKINHYRLQARRIEKKKSLSVIDTSKLNYKKITHRKGKILVERIIGKVINKRGDGRVLNCKKNNKYNYISYKKNKFKKGDIIVSYLIYNPRNNYIDDIMVRLDYKLVKQ